jgi:hypothetical protein
MSYQLVTEPIDHWPLPDTAKRVYPPFTAGYSDTMNLLHRELNQIEAVGPVAIQVVTRRGAADIRRDGGVRADAKIEHPGVRLSFKCKHGDLTYATDWIESYGNRPGWQQNLRAIALGLEALRKVDRYGIAATGEQYRGWLAIEPPRMGDMIAQQILVKYAGFDGPIAQVHRIAKAKTHPDHNGGDRTAWDQVEAAAQILGLTT